MVVADRTVHLDEKLETVSVGQHWVCCGLQKLDRAMMLQGCRKADRAEVVERDRFATPNSLKSHRQRNLLPQSEILMPERQSCACFRGQYTLRKITRHSNQRTAAKSP